MFLRISVLKKSIPKVHRRAWVWLFSGTQMRPITLLFTNRPRPPTKLSDTFKLDCENDNLDNSTPDKSSDFQHYYNLVCHFVKKYRYTHFVNLSFV